MTARAVIAGNIARSWARSSMRRYTKPKRVPLNQPSQWYNGPDRVGKMRRVQLSPPLITTEYSRGETVTAAWLQHRGPKGGRHAKSVAPSLDRTCQARDPRAGAGGALLLAK